MNANLLILMTDDGVPPDYTHLKNISPDRGALTFELDSLSDSMAWATAERLLFDCDTMDVVLSGAGREGMGKVLRFLDKADRSKKLNSLTLHEEVKEKLKQFCKRFS